MFQNIKYSCIFSKYISLCCFKISDIHLLFQNIRYTFASKYQILLYFKIYIHLLFQNIRYTFASKYQILLYFKIYIHFLFQNIRYTFVSKYKIFLYFKIYIVLCCFKISDCGISVYDISPQRGHVAGLRGTGAPEATVHTTLTSDSLSSRGQSSPTRLRHHREPRAGGDLVQERQAHQGVEEPGAAV